MSLIVDVSLTNAADTGTYLKSYWIVSPLVTMYFMKFPEAAMSKTSVAQIQTGPHLNP